MAATATRSQSILPREESTAETQPRPRTSMTSASEMRARIASRSNSRSIASPAIGWSPQISSASVGLVRAAGLATGEDRGDVVALVGQGLALRRGQEHVAELEQRDVGQPVRRVERRGAEQAGQDRRPQQRLLGP